MLCSIVLPWGAIRAVGRTEKVVGKKLEAAVAVAAPVARDIVSTRRLCQLEIAAASVKKNGMGTVVGAVAEILWVEICALLLILVSVE
ncbi:unnamed protein product [Sphagnum jensenii]